MHTILSEQLKEGTICTNEAFTCTLELEKNQCTPASFGLTPTSVIAKTKTSFKREYGNDWRREVRLY